MHILLANLLFGGISALLAHQKARNALGWFLAGCLIGPFALVVVFFPLALKPGVTKMCPACSETVRMEAQICRYCQSDLRAYIAAG